jgi:O-antigen/teichoic acid export membrane protein
MGGASLGMRVISIVSAIILARLLDPADFGVVSLVAIVLSTTALFSGLGMGLAVVHSQADRRIVASHAFLATAASGTLLCLLLLAGAPLCAWLLGSQDVVPYIRAMSPLILLGALAAVPEAMLHKDLLFGRVSASVLFSEVLSLALAVVMALNGFGVWSLVVSGLVRAAAYLVLLAIVLPDRARLRLRRWDWPIMRGLLDYGLQAMGGGIVSFIYSIMDNFIVGRTLGPTHLGWYSRAYDFSTRSVDAFMNVIGVVLFPSYTKIQGDPDRLSRAYLKSLRLISFVTVPVSLGMLVTAPETVPTLLGEKWVPMVPAFMVLCGMSLVKTLSGTTGALFASIGRPSYNLRAGLLVLAIMLPSIVLLLPWGITGVAVALLLTHVVGFVFNMYQAGLVFGRAGLLMVRAVGPAIMAGGLMVGAVAITKLLVVLPPGGTSSMSAILIMVIAGGLVYGAFLWWNQRVLVGELFQLALSQVRSRSSSRTPGGVNERVQKT